MGNASNKENPQNEGAHSHAELDVNVIVHAAALSQQIYSNIPAAFTLHHIHEEDTANSRPMYWGIWSRARSVFVVIRGSTVTMDWITNVGALPAESTTKGLKIHSGFSAEVSLEYKDLTAQLLRIVNERGHDYLDRIVITGHSKGGGVAHVLMHRLLTDSDPNLGCVKALLVAVTFAGPMVFSYDDSPLPPVQEALDQEALDQEALDALSSRIHNYLVQSDPVPHLPLIVHSNLSALDRLVTAMAGNYLLVPQLASLKEHLLSKVKDVGKYTHSYKPIGNLYVAAASSPNDTSDKAFEDALFAPTSHGDFLAHQRSAEVSLDISHHAVDTYKKICDNLAQNFKSYVAKAKAGDPEAQFHVGCCFESGQGVDKDEVAAMAWFRKSAAGGHQEGQLRLAVAYMVGQGGLPRNVDRAEMMYELARSHTRPICYSPDAWKWYAALSAQGDGYGQALLGRCYEHGIYGQERDPQEALRLYRLSADQGDGYGQAKLGECYEYGNCRQKRDREEALRLYRLSADQGDGYGQAKLGECYEYGNCRQKRDREEALRLYRLSADQGDGYGQARLKAMLMWT